MKLMILFMLITVATVSAKTYSQATTLTFSLDKATISQVFKEIEQNSDYILIYNEKTLDINRKVSVIADNDSIETILNKVFTGTPNSYQISGRQIVISKSETENPSTDADEYANKEEVQQVVITGTVTDQQGAPIIGATVVVKGTTLGNATDVNGNYSIANVPVNATLVFTFIGMSPQEIPLNGQVRIDVVMKELTKALDEVVVVGYGTQKKESVVGAISQTTNEKLKQTGGVTDLKQALTGQLPGLITVTSSGEPGGTTGGVSATAIYIRGQNTWNGGQPLILVDGVERGMDNLDVSEVENISILKDASATAVFGVKGANGVILVTTKRGTKGKPKISFSYNTTAKMLSKLPKSMDSYDAIKIRDEAIEREVVLNEPSWLDYIPSEIVERYKLPQSAEYAEIYPNVDWKEAMFKDFAFSHRATLNAQGGTGFVNYFGSLAYTHEGDMFKDYNNNKGYDPNYDFDRFNFRSNLDFKITQTTTLKVNLSGYFSKKNTNYAGEGSSTSNGEASLWAGVYGMAPDLMLPRYSDGSWGWTFVTSKPNPVASIYNLGIRQLRTTALNSDFALEQNLDFLTKGLSAKASFYFDNTLKSEGGIFEANHIDPMQWNSYTPEKVVYPDLYTGDPDQDPGEYIVNYPQSSGTSQYDWVFVPSWTLFQESIESVFRRMMYQLQVNYSRKFGLHNVGALGLFKREEYASGSAFKHYREDWVFRTTYDYDTRYLFEMNGAYNGSEQFGPGYRLHFFPSVAVGWNVSNEKFFDIKWINKLKFRFSTGVVGDDVTNQTSYRWLYDSQYTYGGTTILNENIRSSPASPYTWYKESWIGNPDFHWEKAKKNDLGFELGLLDNMFSVICDYYTEDRTDMILLPTKTVPPFYGGTPPISNLGHVKARGYEVELQFDKSTTNGFHYWSALAISHTTNKILKKDDPVLLDSYLKEEGYLAGQTRTQIRTGFYNNWDEVYASTKFETNDQGKLPGGYNILDFNTDGVIKSDDAVPYGYSSIPLNTYSLSLGAGYKGFSVMLQFYGVNNVSRSVPLLNFTLNTDVVFDHVYDYWSKDNQDATSFLPRWKTSGQNIADYYLFDASYLRLKTAEVAYTFDNQKIKDLGLSALKLFLNGENLFFWSDIPDDREATLSGGGASTGAYPAVRRINFGVDLTF
ncbi:MAG: TonB-dependent receptor [Bacteroidales bacterium]|nr:TonB-dependent receptor [Bacteroidales bacterium]